MKQVYNGKGGLWGILIFLVTALVGANGSLSGQSDGTGVSIYIEAECGQVGSRWNTFLDTAAAGGAYVTSQFTSRGGAPGNAPANQVRFEFSDIPATGEFRLYARVSAPSRLSDSYYIRINEGAWQYPRLGATYGAGFQWVVLTESEFQAGTNTVDIAFRESNTYLDKLLLTNEMTVPEGVGPDVGTCQDNPPPPEDKSLFWLEAECAEVGSAWRTVQSEEAAGGAYVTSLFSTNARYPPLDVPKNYLRFRVDDPDPGRYNFWVRTDGRGANTLFVRVNGGPWEYRVLIGRKNADGFRWTREDFPRNFTTGVNYVDIAYSSRGLDLDKILITRYAFQPTEQGGIGADCSLTEFPVVDEGNTFSLEAECADVGSRWERVNTTEADRDEAVVVRGVNALDAPPTGGPADFVTFQLPSADSGTYSLYARMRGATGGDDSFWVRANGGPWYKWWTDMIHSQSEAFVWNEIPTGIPLRSGDNTIDFAYREDGTELDKIFVTTTSQQPVGSGLADSNSNCDPSDPSPEYIWLEAECAEVGDNWFDGGSVVISTDNALDAPPDDLPENRVRFAVTTSENAFSLFARIRAFHTNSNSFWVRIDDGEWYEWEQGIEISTDYAWNELPMLLELTAGEHTVDFAYREAGTWLDKVYLNTTMEMPEGMGEPGQNCGGTVAAAERAGVNPGPEITAGTERYTEAAISLFPNPTSDQVQLLVKSEGAGQVVVVITDNMGRRIAERVLPGDTQLHRVEFDVHAFPAGMYHARILEGDQQTVRSFIKR
ncbi:putative secreted protein (Por secretion system target) [Neolewinella xylanilytica]|uniref:Putative secreted protein (Por secretion system target) n=1 Tax=Neolewinella xylanilytica TaxID=1514080 RepID=A0A2S6I1H9_9BACT|nr:T9SS type A sorting domain-containing protein [Neolewinella xylanilytica]PPK85032.1 putative secreted protein (Por secretion system target) [Neolewinella xylanilytica]